MDGRPCSCWRFSNDTKRRRPWRCWWTRNSGPTPSCAPVAWWMKQRGVTLSGQAVMSAEEERALAFVVGVEGGCPRDVFTVVMDLLLPKWSKLRKGLGKGKGQGKP